MSENALVSIVGKNILQQRKKLGLSQKELAGILNISQEAMGRMEKGSIAPKMSRLQDIANTLQCSVPSLFANNPHDFTINKASIQERISIIAGFIEILPLKKQKFALEFLSNVVTMLLQEGEE